MDTPGHEAGAGQASGPGVAVIDVLPDVVQPRIAYVHGMTEET